MTPGFHPPKFIPTSPLPRGWIQNVGPDTIRNENHPVPAAVQPPVDRDDRNTLDRPPIAERLLPGGDLQFPKGATQLVMAGVWFPICRQENPVHEKLLRLRIRLPRNHRDAGYPTAILILLFDALNIYCHDRALSCLPIATGTLPHLHPTASCCGTFVSFRHLRG